MTYIIMGPQGSGKGTQADIISKKYGLEHVSIGDLLRAEVASGSETGKIVEKYMREGALIPMHINNAIVKKVLEKNKNILLDGYPRNREQAEFITQNANPKCVIIININEEESIKRLTKRLICTATNKIYIEDKITEKDREECEAKGGQLIKRDDDKPEAIKKRLEIYNNETKPVIKIFQEQKIPVIEINGEKTIEEITNEITEKLEPYIEQ
ncbi:MAG: adenylate kinase family protein [Minisyncoccales bacterium]